MRPTVSVVLPVFNGTKTLERALESIAAQTLDSLECILVNDGSTDRSLALLRAFAAKDARFHVLDSPNKGVSHARNLGLEAVQGDLVLFLDCDDVLEPTALSLLCHTLESTGADIAVGHLAYEDGTGALLARSPELPAGPGPWVMSPTQAVETLFRGQPFAGHLHGKLFRASILKALRFREYIHIYEDMVFVLEALVRSRSLAYIPVIVHHYVITDDGALAAALTSRKTTSLAACALMEGLTAQYFPAVLEAAKDTTFQNALWVLEEIASSPKALRKAKWTSHPRKIAQGVIRSYAIPKRIPWVQKVFCWALRMGWPFYLALYIGFYSPLRRSTRYHQGLR